ncbi:hypothetical protein [uncultured Nostoc sp.]|uniref:hypothetical protein n=1 Tax=uncultured Nostoc sp. TaxID=340711 RepID=UPI0035CC7BB5
MANIKIAELQSSLFEEVSATDLDAVHGGQIPGVQAVGNSTGTVLGISQGGGSTFVSSESFSSVSGRVGAADVTFGTLVRGISFPN